MRTLIYGSQFNSESVNNRVETIINAGTIALSTISVSNNDVDWQLSAGRSFKVAEAVDLIWNQQTSPFPGMSLYGVAHNGSDLWVLVGSPNKLASSPDGIDWTPQAGGFETSTIRDVAHNQSNLWVAVGDNGKLATSANGTDWAQQTSSFGTTAIYGVAHNGSNLWVAVGISGTLATSPNGTDWTQQTSSFDSTHIIGVAYDGSGLWVAVGFEGKLATSSDGETWEQQTSSFGSTWIWSIAHNQSDLWVAVGESGKLATSSDGTNWTQQTNGFGTSNIADIAYSSLSSWVAVGNSGKLATSPDGIDWTQQTSSFGTTIINGVAYNSSDLWVAVGSAGKLATYSDKVGIQLVITEGSDIDSIKIDTDGGINIDAVGAINISDDNNALIKLESGALQIGAANTADLTLTGQNVDIQANGQIQLQNLNNTAVDAIIIAAAQGGIDIDAADKIDMYSNSNMVLNASNGISIDAAADIAITAAGDGNITLTRGGTGSGKILLESSAGIDFSDILTSGNGQVRFNNNTWEKRDSSTDEWLNFGGLVKTFTASENLNVGDPVGIYGSKLGKIGYSELANSVFSDTATEYIAVDALGGNTFVIAYKGLSGYGTAIVGEYDGTNINWITGEEVFNDATGSGVKFISVTSLSSNTFAIAYQDGGNSDYGTAIVGTYTGTGISWQTSEIVFNATTTEHITIAALSSDTFVIVYRDASGYGTARIGTYTGTDISWQTSEEVFNEATGPGTKFISIASLGDNTFAVAYQDGGNLDYGTIIIGKYTGSTIEWRTNEIVFNASTTTATTITTLTNNIFIIAYNDSYGRAIIGQYNGYNNINWLTSTATFNAATSTYIAVISLNNNMFIVTCCDTGNSNYGTARIGQLINQRIVWLTDEIIYNTDNTEYNSITYLGKNICAVVYRDGANSDYGTSEILKFAKYIGLSNKQVLANNETTIVFDGYISGLTDLLAGQNYYIDYKNKAITTSGTKKVGIAISDTELLLR